MIDEYLFKNSATMLLNEKGRKIISDELKKRTCKICGGALSIITYIEGDLVICENEHTTCGYEIIKTGTKPFLSEYDVVP